MAHKKLIVLDCDGVILDYNAVFPAVWQLAYGEELKVVEPNAYHAARKFGVDPAQLGSPSEPSHFYRHFGASHWQSMPAFPGAVEACRRFVEAGYSLVCVSSMPLAQVENRLINFQNEGIPITDLISTGGVGGENPKREVLIQLNPVVFVDDLASNFLGLPAGIHKALLHRNQVDSPNPPESHALADTLHADLASFASHWLAREGV